MPWKNGKILILQALSRGPKTNAEIRQVTSLSGPVISSHLKSLAADELILAPPKIEGLQRSERGAKYYITPKGQELLKREQNRRFTEENNLLIGFDLGPDLPESRRWLVRYVETDALKENPNVLKLPEQILEDGSPTFPVPIKALLVMNENGRAAIDPWAYKMLQKYGYINPERHEWAHDERDAEWIDESVASSFAQPTIRKLCEVLFERTRVLCSLHASGEKGSLPTLDNILNFNFQFSCRYEGKKFLDSASKEERVKAKHLLAGMLLLYLGGHGADPMGEHFCWDKADLESLVESGLLTREEIQPLLECCEPLWRGLRYEDCTEEQKKEWDAMYRPGTEVFHTGFYHTSLEELTEEQKKKMHYDYPLLLDLSVEQKRKITISAYRRFYLADKDKAEKD